jgi:hypothetical protein
MDHLHLFIPDLFPPQDIAAEVCAGLRLPVLEKLLARSRAKPVVVGTLEDRLCAEFGVQAIAPVRAAADGLEIGEAYWLCADPVNLQLQRAQMLLMPDVLPTREEAEVFCSTLNAHFSDSGMQFFAPHPLRWYVRLDAEPQLSTTPLRQAAWRDAKFHQPQGADALQWQRMLTEIQMLLYAHPLNQARDTRGELIVSSLWLWGGGNAQPVGKAFDVAGGDSGLAAAFSRVAALSYSNTLPEMLGGQFKKGLWVEMAAGDAWRRGDLYAWRESVLRLEQQLAQPILKALLKGSLSRLTLEVTGDDVTRRFELTRTDAWKLWRGSRPLPRYAV